MTTLFERVRAGLRCGLIGSVLSVPQAYADDPAVQDAGKPAAEESAVETTFLETVTVTATRGPHAVIDVPGTVTVINGTQINKRLAANLQDVVRYEPGVFVPNSVTRQGAGGVNIRGIGGNRVLTNIDGVPAGEEFEFGHFQLPQYALDVETLKSVEILRGPASSLFGSDALGGVVSLVTKDPGDYLPHGASSSVRVSSRADSRDGGRSGTVAAAVGGTNWRSSLVGTYRRGHEADNQGEIDTRDRNRTMPNPQERRSIGVLGKWEYAADSTLHKVAIEGYDRSTGTEILSEQGVTDLGRIFGFGPEVTYLVTKPRASAYDTQQRWRLSVEQVRDGGVFDQLQFRVYAQEGETEQETVELRNTVRAGGPFGVGSTVDVRREGLMTFEQETLGIDLQASQRIRFRGTEHLLTFGASWSQEAFDQIRDRRELDLNSGSEILATDGLRFPTKYFPSSDVDQIGLFVQSELEVLKGRLRFVPGLRFDHFALSVDRNDAVYLSGNLGTEAPVTLSESAVSPRLGVVASMSDALSLYAQVSAGFRAPPFSAINSGFTHLTAGLTRLPNPHLEPETSRGFEMGLRGNFGRASLSVAAFHNDYKDFIELVTLGYNPATGLVEFQQQNLSAAEIWGLEGRLELAWRELWRLHGGMSYLRGEDRTREQPLDSVPPHQLVVGVSRSSRDRRWRGEVIARFVDGKDRQDLPAGTAAPFAPPAYQVVDFNGGWSISDRVSVQVGIFNLLDERYWTWGSVQGLSQAQPALDRYTSPGRNGAVSFRFHWD